MAIIAKGNKKEYTAAPEGLWQAVCVDVVDMGLEHNQRYDKDEHKIQLRWILDEKEAGLDPKTSKPFMVSRKLTLSLGEKSHLRPLLEAWRGKKFSKEELEGFDLECVIGIPCQVQIIHNAGDEGTVWANVQAIVPPARGAIKMRVPEDYVRVCDRDSKSGSADGNGFHAQDEDVPF